MIFFNCKYLEFIKLLSLAINSNIICWVWGLDFLLGLKFLQYHLVFAKLMDQCKYALLDLLQNLIFEGIINMVSFILHFGGFR